MQSRNTIVIDKDGYLRIFRPFKNGMTEYHQKCISKNDGCGHQCPHFEVLRENGITTVKLCQGKVFTSDKYKIKDKRLPEDY